MTSHYDAQKDLIEKITRRTLWESPSHKVFSFFCPQCRSQRRIPLKPHPVSFLNVFRVLVSTVLFTILFFKFFAFKGLFVFFPLWISFEVLYRMRVRSLMACPGCGFDPYLYVQDPQNARKGIEQFWREKFKEKGIPYPEHLEESEEEASLDEEMEEASSSSSSTDDKHSAQL